MFIRVRCNPPWNMNSDSLLNANDRIMRYSAFLCVFHFWISVAKLRYKLHNTRLANGTEKFRSLFIQSRNLSALVSRLPYYVNAKVSAQVSCVWQADRYQSRCKRSELPEQCDCRFESFMEFRNGKWCFYSFFSHSLILCTWIESWVLCVYSAGGVFVCMCCRFPFHLAPYEPTHTYAYVHTYTTLYMHLCSRLFTRKYELHHRIRAMLCVCCVCKSGFVSYSSGFRECITHSMDTDTKARYEHVREQNSKQHNQSVLKQWKHVCVFVWH